MNNILNVIRAIGRDIKALQSNSLKTDKAYELFPTYSTLQSQMTTNIKDKHLELGLDALIDDKLKNGGDPFVTKHQLSNSYVPLKDFNELLHRVETLERKPDNL